MNIITQSAASRVAREVPRRALPVIDVRDVIAGDPEAPLRLADQWRGVWEEVGFMCIVNHGISPEQIDSMFAASKRFHAGELSPDVDNLELLRQEMSA